MFKSTYIQKIFALMCDKRAADADNAAGSATESQEGVRGRSQGKESGKKSVIKMLSRQKKRLFIAHINIT